MLTVMQIEKAMIIHRIDLQSVFSKLAFKIFLISLLLRLRNFFISLKYEDFWELSEDKPTY